MLSASLRRALGDEHDGSTAMRIAVGCLLAHSAATLFSVFAFSTFLAPPHPAWLQTPENQRVATFMFRWGGQTTVVLGALAAALHAASRIGTRRAVTLFAVVFTLALGAELSGTAFAIPFGPYGYTDQLGYLIGGLVPFNIPTSWFYMLYGALAICGRLLQARDDGATKWWWALIGGLVFTAWDVSMDPAMTRTNHWLWRIDAAEVASSPLYTLLGTPFWFGMPLTNWLGWLLVGVVLARVMLWLVPPTVWAGRVAPSGFPLWLYAVNGTLPVAICLSHDMALAGWLGALAMGVPLAAALVAPRRRMAGRARPEPIAAPPGAAPDGSLRAT
jgi:putative membrane protein